VPTETPRLFLAVPPPAGLAARLAALAGELEASAWSLRFSAPEDLHLTLHFLGPTPARLVDDFRRELGALCHARRAFDLPAGGLGCFPDESNPRVLWAGVCDPQGRLRDLFEASRRALNAHRPTPLPAEYRPHVTLARVERLGSAWDPRLLRGLAGQWNDLGTYGVERVALLRVRTEGGPGPRYERLADLPLA
jgi:2'-5' RNA ligase